MKGKRTKKTSKTAAEIPKPSSSRQNGPAKSFLSVGPTLHYSHKNVQRCWLLALAVFSVSCALWSKVVSGSYLGFSLSSVSSIKYWHLGQFTVQGVSIFEYPWQILVLGLLMGIMGISPVLISQLMSFRHSLLFVAAVAFLANLPGFAICLLISCVAAACRPLRFRSRFTAITLCIAPQFVYWGYLGGARGVEPLKFGFSFTPWVCAWLAGLLIAGLVLAVGHYTRYRPELVWTFTFAALLIAVVLFRVKVGFGELDYQLYVAGNNPEQISIFHDHSITETLDKTIQTPAVRRYLEGFFYPSEPIALRTELKKEIQSQLSQGRWPSWLIVPPELNYQAEKQRLLQQYDLFINHRSKSKRMPIGLYYKAMLSEYSPDIEVLAQKEVLHFYYDYPHERSREIWYRLYKEFGNSPESLEARWRMAKQLAGLGKFELADELLAEAQTMLAERLKQPVEDQIKSETFFSPFHAPAESVMTKSKLVELRGRLDQLRNLISKENGVGDAQAEKRLAKFVKLNPHTPDYAAELKDLLRGAAANDPLGDNILLAEVKLIADEQHRAEKLAELHQKFQNTDAGMQALYELGRLKIGQWQQQSEAKPEQKKKYLAEAREILSRFIKLYPDSFHTEQVKENLENLPKGD
jgi:hypothetical protein